MQNLLEVAKTTESFAFNTRGALELSRLSSPDLSGLSVPQVWLWAFTLINKFFSITLAASPPTILFKHGLPTGDKRSIALVHVIINVTLNEIWAAKNLATFENTQQPASATIRKVKHRLRQRIRAAYNFNNIPVFKKTWGHKQVLCKIEHQTLQVFI